MNGQFFILPAQLPRERAIERIAMALRALPQEKAFALTIEEHKPRRSDQQNRALWGLAYPTILKAGGEQLAGWTAEDLHEFFLGEHFGWQTLGGFGKRRMKPLRRSSRLSRKEFAEFFDFIQRKAAELGIVIPDPDPLWWQREDAA